MNKTVIVSLVLIVITAGAGFYAGMQYQQYQRSMRNFQGLNGRGLTGRNGNQAQRGQGQNFRPVNGEILSADSTSITVKLLDGSSKIILINSNTIINKSSEGSVSDLKQGEKVAVFGSENSDGSVTAQNIQLNPVFRNMISGTPRQ